MTDPKRLALGDDLGGALLSSARGDAPRAGARDRAAVALGLAVGTTTAAATSAGTAAAGTSVASAGGSAATVGAGAGAGAVALKTAGTALWLKAALGIAISGAVVGGAVTVKRHSDLSHVAAPAVVAASTPREAPAPAINAPALTPVEPVAPVVPAEVTTSEPIAQRTATRGPEPVRAHAAASTTVAPPESALTRELKMLDAARTALASGDPKTALAELDRAERAFPHGSLRTEAAMIRVEALLARGDKAQARVLAKQLLERDPSGPHARRLSAILEDAPR